MTNRFYYKFVHLLIINFCHFAEIHSIKPDDQNIWATLSKLPSKSNDVNITLRRRHQSSAGSINQADLPKIIGNFSPVGPQEDAKGIIKLLHWCPLGDMMIESPWIALFKDEPFSSCVPSLEPIRIAISKGANAVIVYSAKDLPIQLKDQQKRVLHKPLVLLHDTDVSLLKDIPYLEHEAIAKINPDFLDKSLEQVEHRDYYTISIFLGTLLVLSLISIAAILKFKGRWHKKEPCATQIAKRVLKSMETRKFNFSDHWFFTESCAVCLEEYIPGQEVRILPCRHEFHKSCVDGWLINRRTCPLCLSNILDRPNGNRDGYIYTSKQPPTHTGGGSSSEAVSSSAVMPGNYRRRYDYVDDSIEAEQFGYIQQGFYRHSGEVGCVYGGYPTDSQEGITISAPYEDNNSFSTQAIVPEHRDQMIVACNTRNDEVDSVTEEPSVCRGNLGIDRLMVRDRHKRFSCRRSTPLSTGSYWGVGGSRAMRARRTILPEYSRLRIKLRQCDKNKNNSLIVNNNSAVAFQQQSASPINNSNLSQLKVLPQQHAQQQQQRHFVGSSNEDNKQQVMSHFGPMQVTSLSLKQANNTIPASIHTSNTTTSTLPKCKKQLVNNDSNNLTTSAPNDNKNNATICYNKRRRPPCCSLEDEDEFIWRSSSTFSTVLALNSGSYRSAIKLGCINKLSELSNNHCNNNANNSLVISNFGGCCRLGKFNHKQKLADNTTHNLKCLSNNHNNDCQLNKNNFCNISDNNNETCCKEANSQIDRGTDNSANKNDCHYHYCCYGDQRCANASSSSHYHTLPGRRPHYSHHHRHHHHHLHQFPQPKQHKQEANKNSAANKFPFEKKEISVKQNNENINAYNFSNKSNVSNMKNTRVLNATELDSYKLNNNNDNKTYKSKDLANILFDQSKSSFAPTTSSPLFIPTCNFSTPSSLLTSLSHSKNTLPNKSIDSKSNKGSLTGFNKPSGSVIMPLSVKVVQRSSHKNSASSLNRLPSCDSTPPPPPPSLLSTGSASTGKVRKPKMPTPQGQQRNREPGNFPLSRSLGREIASGFLEGCVDCQRGLEMAAENTARNKNPDGNIAPNKAANETKDASIQMDF